MLKEEIKLVKYLKGMSKVLAQLATEIKEGGFDKESEELLAKVGSNLLFEAKAFTFRIPLRKIKNP